MIQWTPEMDEALRRGTADGVRQHELAERIGVSRRTLRNRRDELNIYVPIDENAERLWQPVEIEKLKYMWRNNFTASQIAGEMRGRSRNAVLGKIQRLGLVGKQGEQA